MRALLHHAKGENNMAIESIGKTLSWKADESLVDDQFHIVVLDATSGKVRRPNAATDIPLGVLQNAPKADEEAVVALVGCGGVSKVVTGASALAIGAIVGMEYIGAADAGKAIAAVATMYPIGTVVVASAAEDDLASVLLCPLTVKA
jgi:hypothetical protein